MGAKLRADGTPYPPKTIDNVYWEARKAKECAERIEAKIENLAKVILGGSKDSQTTIPFQREKMKTLKNLKEETRKKKYAAEWRSKNKDYQKKYCRRKKLEKLVEDYANDWETDIKETIAAIEALFERD